MLNLVQGEKIPFPPIILNELNYCTKTIRFQNPTYFFEKQIKYILLYTNININVNYDMANGRSSPLSPGKSLTYIYFSRQLLFLICNV